MLFRELRVGIRSLARNPGFTTVAVLTLALGVGANTAIFSLVNAALLRPLPYMGPERIVHISSWTKQAEYSSVTAPQFRFWKEQSSTFGSVAAYAYDSAFNLWTGSEPVSVRGLHVSHTMFQVLGVHPAFGRGFLPEEDRPGAQRSVILGFRLWRTWFHGDTGAIGRRILLHGQDYTVVGIMPSNFQFSPSSDLWLPLMPDHYNDPGENFDMLARLKPGLTLREAQSDSDVLFSRYRRQYPSEIGPELLGMRVIPYSEFLGSNIRSSLLILLGAVGMILLIAAANVVNLLLARMTARESEIAVRAALGASRWQLLLHLLGECVLLALFGGAAGVLIAPWALDALLALAPADSPLLPLAGQVRLDPVVLGFAVAISLLAGCFVGLLSALQVRHSDLSRSLKEGGRSPTGARRHRIRGALVVAEMAVSIVLLVGAILLIRTVFELRSVHLGFDPQGLWTMQMSLPTEKFKTNAEVWRFEQQVLQRLKSLPGVTSAASTSNLPLERGQRIPVKVDAQAYAILEHRAISPGYFQTMRMPLLRGRPFLDADTADSIPVAVISESLARRYFPGRAALGEQLSIGRGGWAERPRVIVGVVADSKLNGLGEEPRPVVFVPQSQMLDQITSYTNQVFLAAWVIRSSATLDLSTVQRAVSGVDPQQPVAHLRTMTQVLGDSIAAERFYSMLMTTFALIALVLAGVGIYGVMAYLVSLRTAEIGVRMALGARRSDVLKLLAMHELRLTVAGTLIGVTAAAALTRVLSTMLYGVRPTDFVSFLLVVLVLNGTSFLAGYIPLHRATRVDPIVALRRE